MTSTRRIKQLSLLAIIFLCVYGLWSVYKTQRYIYAMQAVERQAREKRLVDWQLLEQEVRQRVASYPGEVSLLIKDMATGWEISHGGDHMLPAASVIKIGIMSACLQAVQAGTLSLDECLVVQPADQTMGSGVIWLQPAGQAYTISELMRLMIGQSDNTASNMLIKRLGMEKINQFLLASGLTHTRLERPMMDFAARARGHENYTSAADMAKLLENIYSRRWPTPELSELALDYLKNQKVHDRIPAKLPHGVVVAHKTGYERFLCHDAGIVFMTEGDYLICVLTKSHGSFNASRLLIAEMAYDVYEYMQTATPLINPEGEVYDFSAQRYGELMHRG